MNQTIALKTSLQVALFEERLRKEAITETFKDVERLIYKITHRFAFRAQLPFEELYGQSLLIFVRCYDWYDRRKFKAKFSTFLQFILTRHLNDYLDKEMPARKHLELNEEIAGAAPLGEPAFRILLECTLTGDAQEIIHLILDCPPEIAVVVSWRGARTPHSVKAALREHLRDLGWSPERIRASFAEISEALCIK